MQKTKFILILILLICAFFAVYIRSQSILIGYQLGRLKEEERLLLEQKNKLQTEYAKITDRQNLTKIAGVLLDEEEKPK